MIVFDRGVDTDCPARSSSRSGLRLGADAAEFLVDNVDPGGKILALRILPGVDVLETRWSAAQEVFADSELEIVGDEQTEGDAANTKQIVSDYIAREGELDGIWMDAGATASPPRRRSRMPARRSPRSPARISSTSCASGRRTT